MKTVAKNIAPTLAQEVVLLRSYVIGVMGKDREGEYRSSFVARTLRSLDSAAFEFKNTRDFLVRVR